MGPLSAQLQVFVAPPSRSQRWPAGFAIAYCMRRTKHTHTHTHEAEGLKIEIAPAVLGVWRQVLWPISEKGISGWTGKGRG